MFLVQVGYSLILFGLWHYGQIGGADVKVIVPIIFTLSTISFCVFMGAMAFSGVALALVYLFVFKKREIPYFIPITIGFVMTMLI